ncbi:MAG: D-2-hydroxyacid dehydrogenase [Desulfovibrio sp.]|nr:D-2-hydroxyacid dehydrogenase [Desulfovibrio sp.]
MKIVVLDSYPLDCGDVDWKKIESLGELVKFDSTSSGNFADRVGDAEIILTNKVPVRAAELAHLKKCRLVGVLATGANILDLEALASAGLVAVNVPGYGVQDVAQHALALLLELARHTALHSQSVKSGEWQKRGWCYWLKPPLCLTGLTLGLAGFGAIGKTMGSYGHALGMKILAWSRSGRGKADYPFEFASLDQLLGASDVISLHCPVTPQTENMINAETLGKMKKGALLINTARGGLVDEQAVARALESGQLGGLGTDVMAIEPPDASSPLFRTPNTLITPHMAWATLHARQNIVDIMAANIATWQKGSPVNVITPLQPANRHE